MFGNDPISATDLFAHELFEAHASESPDTIAICSKCTSLTYAQAQSLSTILAQRIIQAGIRPEDNVALSFEHSVWTPIAILAAWKAGTAVTLLPSGPASRVETILSTINPTAMLVSSKRLSRTHAGSYDKVPRLLVDESLLQLPTALPLLPLLPPLPLLPRDTSAVAYTMFTSGSTGTPKGAQIEHKQFAIYVQRWAEAIGITKASRVYGWCSYMFDVSMSDIFSSLCSGATLCVPSEDDRLNRIPQSMSELQVTHAEFVPSVLATIDPSDVNHQYLKVVSMVGEKPTRTVVDRWATIPSLTLFNAYGPAECCPHSSISNLTSSISIPSNIGRTLGPALWIVDSDTLELIKEPGKEGELLIEGAFVGRGYLQNPQQTSEAFICVPSWLKKLRGHVHHRLYRTGDICKYASDGTIEYVARNDNQIKINGQRMELGEVEYVLRKALPKLSDVAVVVGRKGSESASIAQLVAFIAIHADYNIAHGSDLDGVSQKAEKKAEVDAIRPFLREQLQRTLPSFMVPAQFIAMEFIPRLPSGKIDRKCLVEVASNASVMREKSSYAYDIPLTRTEEKIRLVWASLFGIDLDRIHADSDFFDLGGDSMVALRMRSELLRAGINLSMQSIFENPTLTKLATVAVPEIIEASIGIPSFSLLPPGQEERIKSIAAGQCQVKAGDIQDIFHAPGSACYFMLTSQSVPTGWMLFNSFPITPDVDLERYLECWRAVILTFSNLRSRIIQTDTGIWQVVLGNATEPIRFVDSLEEHFKHEKTTKMGWGQPLSRYCVVNEREKNCRYFVWTASHAIHDNWSVDLVYRMVQDAYLAGEQVMRESMMTKSFVKYRMALDVDPIKSWFHQYMDGAIPTRIFNVPTGFRYEKDTTESWTWLIPDYILQAKHRKNITLSSVVSIAWALVFSRYTGSNDITLNLIRSGRHIPLAGADEHIGGLAGYFPIRVKFDSSDSVNSVLRNYQRDWTKSSEFDACSWNELVGELTPPNVKAACAAAVGINIVPADTWDNEEEVEVKNGSCLTQRVRRSELFPRPSAHHLGPSQNPLNINVLLPRRKNDLAENTEVRFVLRRDTQACTGEIANAFVESVKDVGLQLLIAPQDAAIADIVVPDVRHIPASACSI